MLAVLCGYNYALRCFRLNDNTREHALKGNSRVMTTLSLKVLSKSKQVLPVKDDSITLHLQSAK